MEKERQHELIEKYLAGTLAAADEADFEGLRQEPAFNETLRLHRQLAENLSSEKLHRFRAQVQAADQAWAQGQKPTAKVRRLTFGRQIGIAASLLLLLALSLYLLGPFSGTQADTLFALHFEPYQMVLNQRSETADLPLQQQGIAAYQSGDYQAAAAAFRQLAAEAPQQELFSFYAALSDLAAGAATTAVARLEVLSREGSDGLQQQSRWYLALALLKAEETARCKDTLSQIKAGDYRYQKAQELLKQLK